MSVIILFQARINYNGNYSSDPMSRKWFRKKILKREHNPYFYFFLDQPQKFKKAFLSTANKLGQGDLFERVSKFHLMDLSQCKHSN